MSTPIEADILDRKPARKVADVPETVRDLLSRGGCETKNLTEWLAVDRLRLAKLLVSELPVDSDRMDWDEISTSAQGLTGLKLSKLIAGALAPAIEVSSDAWKQMSVHPSDVVREWAALILGRSQLTFQKKLAWIKPIADATNAGLREIAWIALREDVIRDPAEAVKRLVPWTGSRSPNLRRFASEATRPRGVWAAHVEKLKAQPEIALEILEALKQDETKYVKDSVANWLNDASKSKPQWVLDVTERWLRETDSEHTNAIVNRGLRTLRKNVQK